MRRFVWIVPGLFLVAGVLFSISAIGYWTDGEVGEASMSAFSAVMNFICAIAVTDIVSLWSREG